jgi:hypothetical protein
MIPEVVFPLNSFLTSLVSTIKTGPAVVTRDDWLPYAGGAIRPSCPSDFNFYFQNFTFDLYFSVVSNLPRAINSNAATYILAPNIDGHTFVPSRPTSADPVRRR